MKGAAGGERSLFSAESAVLETLFLAGIDAGLYLL